MFYTGSYFDNTAYTSMVKRLHELSSKWNFSIIDLFSNTEFNSISAADYQLYMADPIHPTKAGYLHWWYPEMKAQLVHIISE